jgi:hypothetical protein
MNKTKAFWIFTTVLNFGTFGLQLFAHHWFFALAAFGMATYSAMRVDYPRHVSTERQAKLDSRRRAWGLTPIKAEMVELTDKLGDLQEEAAWTQIINGPGSSWALTNQHIDRIEAELVLEAERQRVAALTPEELAAEADVTKWHDHITRNETQLAGAMGVPVEMLWDENKHLAAKVALDRDATVQDMLTHLESLPATPVPSLIVDVLPPAEVQRIHNEITSVDDVVEYRAHGHAEPIRRDHYGLKCYTAQEVLFGKTAAERYDYCNTCKFWHSK